MLEKFRANVLKRKIAFNSLSSLAWGKSRFVSARSCARANDAKIVRSGVAQCNTKESHKDVRANFFFNIDFFLKISPLKDDELVMSEM